VNPRAPRWLMIAFLLAAAGGVGAGFWLFRLAAGG
jgi:hypothetical protein